MEQTESCQRGMRRRDWVKVEGLAKDHICVAHRHGQQCGAGQREGGWEPSGSVKGGETGTSVIVPTTKIKLKNNGKR